MENFNNFGARTMSHLTIATTKASRYTYHQAQYNVLI